MINLYIANNLNHVSVLISSQSTSNRDERLFAGGNPGWPGNPTSRFFFASAQVKAHVAMRVKFTWLIMFTDYSALPISVVGPHLIPEKISAGFYLDGKLSAG